MQSKYNFKTIQIYDAKTETTQSYIMILDLLGRGYYGSVYKAFHKDNPNKVFAVKVINLQRPEAKQEILKQLQIIEKIPQSPNLVETHKQHLQSTNNLYIFQEFCNGGNLLQWKQRNKNRLLAQNQILDMFYQLVHGYFDLERAGIIHEDIKPSNILIKGKLYKYCDFGVSKLVSKLKVEQNRKGTVSYMPLQKLSQKFVPSTKSDIYSLGVTLYEVIFGFHPYLKQRTSNPKEYVSQLNQAQLCPIQNLLKRISNNSLKSRRLIEIIQRMISLKSEYRISLLELKDIIFNQEPFKDMSIPKQLEELQFESNCYEDFMLSSNGQKSCIYVFDSNAQFQNKLIPQNFTVQFQDAAELAIQREARLRLSKIKDQERKDMLSTLIKSYEVIKNVVYYLKSGINNLALVYSEIEQDQRCNKTFFNSPSFEAIQGIYSQNVTHVMSLLIIRFNRQIMKNFSKSIENYSELSSMIDVWKDNQFLEFQVSMFLAEDNIKNISVKRALTELELEVEELADTLLKQFDLILKQITSNSTRINFKNDLMNLLFLKYVNEVVRDVLKLKGVCLGENSSLVHNISQEGLMNRLNKIVSDFNEWKTYKLEPLKQIFYSQIQEIQKTYPMIYDTTDDTTQFVNIEDLIEEIQQNESIDLEQTQSKKPQTGDLLKESQDQKKPLK